MSRTDAPAAAGPRICLFARPIVPGRAKTRLIPALGPEGAARLYAAFLADTARSCGQVDARLELWIAGEPDHVSLAHYALPRVRQPETDLGGRMRAALTAGRAAGPTLCVGSDAPTLPAGLLRQAFLALGHADLVLGPAADGGFTVIGAAGPRLPDLCTGIRYSTRHALADTVRAAQAAGLRVALLPPTYDVDTPADLRLLALQLTLDPGVAPATARVI